MYHIHVARIDASSIIPGNCNAPCFNIDRSVCSEDQYVVVDYAPRIHVEATYIEEEQYPHWLPNGVPGGCKNLFAMALLENHEGKNMEFIFACDSQ